MRDNSPYTLSVDPASTSRNRQFPRSMAGHLVRSMLMRGEDSVLLVAIADVGTYTRVEKTLWAMNSLACDVQGGIFRASGNVHGRREVAMVNRPDHSVFVGMERGEFAGLPLTVVTDTPLPNGSPLHRLAVARDAVTITLEAAL